MLAPLVVALGFEIRAQGGRFFPSSSILSVCQRRARSVFCASLSAQAGLPNQSALPSFIHSGTWSRNDCVTACVVSCRTVDSNTAACGCFQVVTSALALTISPESGL
ncbi:MAG: hypothetical protein EB141_20205 [Verrucomicrobia bacterium]|nr:hypothetical protein [Verrucomicrobiota bacterium]